MKTNFVDSCVVDFYKTIIKMPYACGLVVTSNRVRADHSMDHHFDLASSTAINELRAQNDTETAAHIGIIVHGGNFVYKGGMGIYYRDLDNNKVTDFHARLAKECEDIGLDSPKPYDQRQDRPSALYEANELQPLLEHYDRMSSQTDTNRVRVFEGLKGKMSYVQLPLLLSYLRRLFPEIPIIIVGHSMVRRCLCLVGTDYLEQSQPPSTQSFTTNLVITHMLIWASASAKSAGMIQSHRGPGGGYSLVSKPEYISLKEVVSAIEGEQTPKADLSADLWSDLQVFMQEQMSHITLDKILQGSVIQIEPSTRGFAGIKPQSKRQPNLLHSPFIGYRWCTPE
jgi:hypothetical protein